MLPLKKTKQINAGPTLTNDQEGGAEQKHHST